jgi:hypothetical protein
VEHAAHQLQRRGAVLQRPGRPLGRLCQHRRAA